MTAIDSKKNTEPDASSPQGHLLTAAKGSSILFAGRIFSHAGRFLTVVLLARVLAAEQYGHYSLTLTTAEVLGGLASLGLHKALVRFIPVFVARRDRAGLRGTLRFCVGLNAAFSVLLAVGLYFSAELLAHHIFDDGRLASLLRIISLFLPFFALADTIAAATRGFKNFHYTAIGQYLSRPLIKVSLLLLLVLTGLTTGRALVATGVAQIAVIVLLLYFLRKQLRAHVTTEVSQVEPGSLFRYSLPLYLSDLLNQFSGRFQILFLGTLGTATHVGVFALARRLTRLSAFFQNSIRSSSEPVMAELLTGNPRTKWERDRFAGVYQNLTRWTFALNLPLLLILVLLARPILSLFGETFTEGVTLLFVFAARRILRVATGLCGVVLDMSNYTVLRLLNSVVRVAILIGLNFWLIPKWGAFGAAVAVSVSEGTVSLLQLLQVGIVFRTLPYNMGFLKPVGAGFAAAAASVLLGQWLPPDANMVNAAGNALAILVTYGGATLMMGLSREERAMLMRAHGRAQALIKRVPAFATSQ